jgi:succinoglycan biosynthesis transport protein ExoP
MSIQQILYILWRRIWILLLAFATTLATAGALLILLPARYDATATAEVDAGQANPVTGTTKLASNEGNFAALVASNRVATEVVKRLGLARTPQAIRDYEKSGMVGYLDIDQWMASQLLLHVSAGFKDFTSVFAITYKSASATESALLANTFLAVFIDAAIAAKEESAQQTAQWFDPQLQKMEEELRAARAKMLQAQVQDNLLGPATDSENSQLMSISADLSRAKSELLSLQSQLAGPPEMTADSSDAQAWDQGALVQLKNSLTSVNSSVQQLQAEVGANNPKLAERLTLRKTLLGQIEAQIAEYRKGLPSRIEAQKSKVAFLESALAEQLKKMVSVQDKREALSALARDVQIREEAVDRLGRSAAVARLESKLSFSNIVLLDKATPPISPSFPKPPLILGAGAGLGLALGLVLAMLAEALDRRVRQVADLEFVSSVPVLGILVGGKSTRGPRSFTGSRISSAHEGLGRLPAG